MSSNRWRQGTGLLRTRSLSLLGVLVIALALLSLMLPKATSLAQEPVAHAIDLHVDLSYRTLYKKRPFALAGGQFSVSQVIAGQVGGVVLPLYVPLDASPGGRGPEQFERSYAHVFKNIVETAPYSLPGCNIRSAGGKPRSLQTWLAFEGSDGLATDAAGLRPWVARGVRIFGIVHTVHNQFAGSSGQPNAPQGLTRDGKDFVRAVIEVGGLLDVSHAADQATNETLTLAEQMGGVVVATHSNARALAPHPRNLTDRQVERIAALGGVIGINFYRHFLRNRDRQADLSVLLDQIDYLRKLGGLGVVALGSDFEGGITPIQALSDASRYPVLAEALQKHGYSNTEIHSVFSENALRVLCPTASR